MGDLDGVRVLDLSRLLPGPACTWMLRGLGASVDLVEAPGGDLSRHMPPFVEGVGTWFAAFAGGKRSLVLDTRSAKAPEILRRLAPRYDVLVEGFRPGVLESLGLDEAFIEAHCPRLIVARLSGWGQTGPWADRPGHDVNYLGVTGALGMSASAAPLPLQVADLNGAFSAAFGIAAALYARERHGRGRVLDISLTESALAGMAPFIAGATSGGRDPAPSGEILTGGVPVYGIYTCQDGRRVTVGALEPKFQAALAEHSEVSDDALRALFLTRPRDAWVELLAGACVGPVLTPTEAAAHPHLAARGAFERLGHTSFVRPPLGAMPRGPTPALGEHTSDVLAEVASAAEISDWRASGAFGRSFGSAL
jgi:alpha-methylacyl-CoA racemase